MKIIRNTKTLASLTFALALAMTPALGLADSNTNKNHHDDDKDKTEVRANASTSCITAWGQLLKHGWKSTNSQLSISTNCQIPFGIFKKWDWHGTTTNDHRQPDTVAPVINSFVIAPQTTTAEASWTTNEKTKGVVFYGTTTPVVSVNTATSTGALSNSVYSSNSLSVTIDTGKKLTGKRTLRNLKPDTTYYAILAVRDASGNVTVSNVVSFTTTHELDTSAPVITNIMTTLKTLGTLTVSWFTNEPATSAVFYGTSSLDIAASGTARAGTTTLSTTHSVDVPRLSTTTPEHFVIQSVDAAGNVRTSSEYSVFLPF